MNEINRKYAIAAVVLAALAVYANSLWNGFAYDDLWIIVRNTRVHQLSDMSKIWLTPYWPSFGSQLGLYRPLAIFAFAVQWALSGGEPWLFHLVNVLLHAGVSVLVFLLIEKLFTRTAAFAGALVFAVHPLHTEAVSNVVGQNELWAALGVLAACLIWVNRPEGITASWRRRLAIIALFFLALLAKESAVVLPGLLVLLDFAQGRVNYDREKLLPYVRRTVGFMLLFVIVLGAYLALRYHVLGSLTGTNAAPGLPHLSEQYRLLNAFRAWPEFVRLLFFPLDLAVDYAPGVILPAESFTPMVLLGMLLVLTSALLLVATPQAPRAGLAAGWFLITILPVSNLFFPIGVLIAERTLYLPSLAVCLLAGYAWDAARRSAERETRRLALAGGLAVLAFFGVRTVIRNPDWDSLATVWRGLHRDHPESYRSQWVNAISMWNQGRPDLAEKYFELAYKLWSRDSQLLAEWGNFYIGQRRYDKAIPLLEKARDMTPFVPRTHEYLAYAYLYGGRPADALASAEHAATMPGAHAAVVLPILAAAHDAVGNHAEAAAAWERVIKLKQGDLWLNWAMLARAQARAGRMADATRSAEMAVAKTREGTRSGDAARKLRSAVATGCFAGGAEGCDPLSDWQVVAMNKPEDVR